jgi:hypothetical protein
MNYCDACFKKLCEQQINNQIEIERIQAGYYKIQADREYSIALLLKQTSIEEKK